MRAGAGTFLFDLLHLNTTKTLLMLKSNSLKNPTHDLSIPEILKSHLVAELLDQGNHHKKCSLKGDFVA